MTDQQPASLNQRHVEIIEQAQWLRGWITGHFAQIEFLLGDLIQRCRAFPEYQEFTKTISHSASKRVAKLRAMMELAGPLSPFAERLEGILAAFLENYDTRNLLAHGFSEFHHTPAGDVAMVYKRFERASSGGDILVQRVFRPDDLGRERKALSALTDRAMRLFLEIHERLGWVGSKGDDITSLFAPA